MNNRKSPPASVIWNSRRADGCPNANSLWRVRWSLIEIGTKTNSFLYRASAASQAQVDCAGPARNAPLCVSPLAGVRVARADLTRRRCLSVVAAAIATTRGQAYCQASVLYRADPDMRKLTLASGHQYQPAQ